MRGERVLVIEPDPGHQHRLKAALEKRFREPAHIVASADAAIRVIERHLPDLVLTSSLLRPAEVGTLTAHLKARPDTSHIPVLITPHFEDAQHAPSSSFHFLWRSKPLDAPPASSSTDAFLQQLDGYLDQSHAARTARRLIAPLSGDIDRPAIRLVAPSASPAALQETAFITRPLDRRRAPRARHDQLPWLRLARLPWGSDLEVVDVSRSGVLVETTARITPGALVDLEFLSKDVTTTVPSRVLRTTVAHVDRLGVRYHVAAAFTRDLHLLDPGDAPQESLVKQRAIVEILTRTLVDADTCGSSQAIHDRFEREVQRLVPVCSVRIRRTAAAGNCADESVYFTIPAVKGGAVLQATFDGSRPPSAMEFEVLKSSARLAAVLLDFAPLEHECEIRLRA